MKVLGFRHFGHPVRDMENSIEFYRNLGFEVLSSGSDIRDGNHLSWVKMINNQKFVLELVSGPGARPHLAFTVDELVPDRYISLTPSGHKIQFEHHPDGFEMEMVLEPPKKGKP